MSSAAAEAATRYQQAFPGRAEELSRVRREVADYLGNCPVADDLVFIVNDSLNSQHELEGSEVFAAQDVIPTLRAKSGRRLQAAARRRGVSHSALDVRFLWHYGRGHCGCGTLNATFRSGVVTHR